MAQSKLAAAVRKALSKSPPGDLGEVLEPWDNRDLSMGDANDLCELLREIEIGRLLDTTHGDTSTPLYSLVMLFQAEKEEGVGEYLAEHGLPELARLFDLGMAGDPPAHPFVMMAKMFAGFQYEPGVERVAKVARRFPEEYFLSVAFNMFSEEDHPHGPALLSHLRDPLPEAFAAVLTLDLANALARQKRIDCHPFDTPEGHSRLEEWLKSPEEESYAHSATAALPFISETAAKPLLALAMDHDSMNVQMEGAWASAYRGGTAGITMLARLCEDPAHSLMAQQYLTELGHEDRIPESAKDPDFQACAGMCQWLAHPSEFGAPPSNIEQYDCRELDWPPTNDRRWVWLFKYTYTGHNEDGSDEVGIGMVGSTTFALFGESTANMSPEDVYGLHCCWELEMNEDPRAPKKRTAKAGRKLLGI